MKNIHLDKGQRVFLWLTVLLLAFLILRPVYVPPERQIAQELHWPEKQVTIFYQQDFGEKQLFCFQLEGSDVLGYAVASTGKYPQIERVRTNLGQMMEGGINIWSAYSSLHLGEEWYYLFLSLHDDLAEIRHTWQDTSVSYPVNGSPSVVLIPDEHISGTHEFHFLDKDGNELD